MPYELKTSNETLRKLRVEKQAEVEIAASRARELELLGSFTGSFKETLATCNSAFDKKEAKEECKLAFVRRIAQGSVSGT